MRGNLVYLQKNNLLTIYKSFVRIHLDWSDVLYDKLGNKNFINEVEKVQ